MNIKKEKNKRKLICSYFIPCNRLYFHAHKLNDHLLYLQLLGLRLHHQHSSEMFIYNTIIYLLSFYLILNTPKKLFKEKEKEGKKKQNHVLRLLALSCKIPYLVEINSYEIRPPITRCFITRIQHAK